MELATPFGVVEKVDILISFINSYNVCSKWS